MKNQRKKKKEGNKWEWEWESWSQRGKKEGLFGRGDVKKSREEIIRRDLEETV